MTTIVCGRCSETKPPLDEAPTGGQLGEKILGTVCSDCWDEWRTASAQLINHYGLNLGAPDHRKQLREAMKEFLSLENK
ncbi:MAG: Fe(2+)-trafficking protein [Chloroflexi bacterium]|nr:Fe(2+)-trafficking protein [Chloroflexota bacterium]MCI0850326.1 Fe(2+)-trafficking protein [Chloroflexota bacterium]